MPANQSSFADQSEIVLRDLAEILKREGEDAVMVAAKAGIIASAVFIGEIFGRNEAARTLLSTYERISSNRMVHIPWHRAGEKASA